MKDPSLNELKVYQVNRILFSIREGCTSDGIFQRDLEFFKELLIAERSLIEHPDHES